jgi:hypothetical protein
VPLVSRDKLAAQRTVQRDRRNQHERFVRDAIARSLLTLPFASLDVKPFSVMYGYYKQLLASATTGELPPTLLIAQIIELIEQDVAVHEMCGNHLKAEIEQHWCAGLQLHFTWGQGLVTP